MQAIWTLYSPHGRYTGHIDLAYPYKAVCPTLDGEVLQVLARTTIGLTGRQVALLTGRTSHSGVLAVLNRLTEHGLVRRVELGRAFLFSLNRDHLAYPAVVALSGLRTSLLGRIQQELSAWQIAPVHLSVFGSAARGDGDTSSDVDLLVVRPVDVFDEDRRWRTQLEELEGAISRWTGNHAAILEASETDLAQLTVDEPPIVAQLRSDAVVLAGASISTLLGER